MSESAQTNESANVGQLALWFGLLGGVIVWVFHLLVSYAFVPVACNTGLDSILYGTAVATLSTAIASVLVAGRTWRRTHNAVNDGHIEIQRSYFLGVAGIILSGFFVFVIIVQSLPMFLQGACEAAGSVRI